MSTAHSWYRQLAVLKRTLPWNILQMQQFKYQEQRTEQKIRERNRVARMIYSAVLCSKSMPRVLSGSTMKQFHASSIRYDLLTNVGDIRKYWFCRREERLYKIDVHSNENGILDAFHFSLPNSQMGEGRADSSVRSVLLKLRPADGAEKESNTPLNLIMW